MMRACRRGSAAFLLFVLASRAACSTGPRESPSASIGGPWRWIGSIGGIVGIRPTPAAEGIELVFIFRPDGNVAVYANGSTVANIPYRIDPEGPPNDPSRHPSVRYGEPLTAFPFDPIVRRQAVTRAGPDTLILTDPCCHRYRHEFVRVD